MNKILKHHQFLQKVLYGVDADMLSQDLFHCKPKLLKEKDQPDTSSDESEYSDGETSEESGCDIGSTEEEDQQCHEEIMRERLNERQTMTKKRKEEIDHIKETAEEKFIEELSQAAEEAKEIHRTLME